MVDQHPTFAPNDPEAADCYRKAIRALKGAGVEFMLGGAFSLGRNAGIRRDTKDLDVFLRPADRDRALEALAAADFRTEITYTHWLAKAFGCGYFIDLIYSSGNAIAAVDDAWFQHADDGEAFGERVKLCPAEESIWSKSFIMERNRYDGADIAHILRARGASLDWQRLLGRFGSDWRVLYSHLVLFGFVYPAEQDKVPAWVMRNLSGRLERELDGPAATERICRGTLLAATQYIPDIEQWGYADARLIPNGTMTPGQVAEWTAGVLTGR